MLKCYESGYGNFDGGMRIRMRMRMRALLFPALNNPLSPPLFSAKRRRNLVPKRDFPPSQEFFIGMGIPLLLWTQADGVWNGWRAEKTHLLKGQAVVSSPFFSLQEQ
jgi:hypothetical protein